MQYILKRTSSEHIQLDLPKGNDGQVEQLNSLKKARNTYERGEPDKM